MAIKSVVTQCFHQKSVFLGALLSALLLTSCGGGGGASAALSSGLANFSLIDAPACSTVSDVYVTITGVQLVGEQGTYTMTLTTPQKVDLVTLTNSNTLNLGQISAPAGTYQRVNLLLAPTGTVAPYANYAVVSGTPQPLSIPSSAQSGFKINGEFTLAANGQVNLTVDFNACRSVVVAGNSGNYILKPVLNLFDDDATGTVSGVVQAGSTATPLSGAVVMVESPVTGQVIRSTVTASDGSFILPFLPPGNAYVVVVSSPVSGSSPPVPNIQPSVVTGVPVQAGVVTQLGTLTTNAASTDTTYNGTIALTNDDTSTAVVVVADVSLPNGGPVVTLMETNAQSSSSGETYALVLPAGTTGTTPENIQVASYATPPQQPLVFSPLSSLPVTLWAYAENGSSGSTTAVTNATIAMSAGTSTFESEDN